MAIATSEDASSSPKPSLSRRATALSMLQWLLTLVIIGWCVSLQIQIRDVDGPIVQERIKTLEASSLLTQQALQINCNGNDSFTVLDSNAFVKGRFCLLANATTINLPDVFASATIVANTTEFNHTAEEYFRFEGITEYINEVPYFYISTSFSYLCGHYSARTYPDDFVWCLALTNLKCGRSNLVQAQVETAPSYSTTIDVELSFSIDACAILDPL
jgi:hypothetical protein